MPPPRIVTHALVDMTLFVTIRRMKGPVQIDPNPDSAFLHVLDYCVSCSNVPQTRHQRNLLGGVLKLPKDRCHHPHNKKDIGMTTLNEIKTAITHLTEEERQELRTWYEQIDAEQWDAQIEQDVAAGRLDTFADEAIQAFRSANVTEL